MHECCADRLVHDSQNEAGNARHAMYVVCLVLLISPDSSRTYQTRKVGHPEGRRHMTGPAHASSPQLQLLHHILRRTTFCTLPSGNGIYTVVSEWICGMALSHRYRASRLNLWPRLPHSTDSRMTLPVAQRAEVSVCCCGSAAVQQGLQHHS